MSQQIDLKGQVCLSCKKGRYWEAGGDYDDLNYVECNQCGHKTKRYVQVK